MKFDLSMDYTNSNMSFFKNYGDATSRSFLFFKKALNEVKANDP